MEDFVCGTDIDQAVEDLRSGRTNPTATNMSSSNDDPAYLCLTQRGEEPTIGSQGSGANDEDPSLVLGLDTEIPRWAAPLTLKCYVDAQTFPPDDSATVAAEAFDLAAAEWTAVTFGVGVVRTTDAKEAHFNVVYRDKPATVSSSAKRGNLLALAFFPHQVGRDIRIFQYALDPQRQFKLKNVFLHELGHVFGLRHEFAIAKEGKGAVQFMEPNEYSVMAYKPLPRIQPSDERGIRGFYKLAEGADIDGSVNLVKDYMPKPRGDP